MSADAGHRDPGDVGRGPAFTVGKSRPPRMTYSPWTASQGVELAATAPDAWYRRCPRRGCRVWAGPYTDASWAKADGLVHKWLAHPGDAR